MIFKGVRLRVIWNPDTSLYSLMLVRTEYVQCMTMLSYVHSRYKFRRHKQDIPCIYKRSKSKPLYILSIYVVCVITQKVEEKFLSFRRGWRYGQDKVRALFVQKLVCRAIHLSGPGDGSVAVTEMRVVGQIGLANSRTELPKTAGNNSLDSLSASAIGFSNRSIRTYQIFSR